MSGLCPQLIVRSHPNHAYVGALIAQKYYKPMLPFLAYPIMGHHAGLYDYDEYESVFDEKQIPADVDASPLEVKLTAPKLKAQPQPYECNHIIRMLFSCLVDADFLDTERFMNEEQAKMRGGKKSLKELLALLEGHLEKLKTTADDTPVNRIRNQVQQTCIQMADSEPGFYSLTVPTGGGKTLSSLVWAMRHALKHDMKRIVIAIPYTSIIVQTAQILRDIFGAENVLEHHSNVSFEELTDKKEDANELALKMRLATENWDYPIVVTTNVQLFESMYSSKPSQCRKLHNLCNSVLILDEVQTLPTNYLQPIVNALKAYQRQFGMSVLFTTASQPVLEGEHRGCNPQVVLKGMEKVTEIIPKDYALHDKLRRVRLHFDKAGISRMLEVSKDMLFRTANEEFHLIDDKTTPVIVNWRCGMDFVEKLKKDGPSYHLMKQLSGYSVNVRQHDMQLLQQAGVIEEVLENVYVISNPAFYDENVGLVVTNQWLEETYIL